MEELKTQLEDMTRLNHPNLIAVVAVKALNQQGYLCGENNKLTAYYQHFAQDLSEELSIRVQNR